MVKISITEEDKLPNNIGFARNRPILPLKYPAIYKKILTIS